MILRASAAFFIGSRRAQEASIKVAGVASHIHARFEPDPDLGDAALVRHHLTSSIRLSEWLLNSGAYMHWISAMPVW